MTTSDFPIAAVVRPRSWWFIVAGAITVIAAFLCLLTTAAPVRGAGDLAAIAGPLTILGPDRYGNLTARLAGYPQVLQVSAGDLDYLDRAGLERAAASRAPLTALLSADRLAAGDTTLIVFGLADSRATYLDPAPLIAARERERTLVMPGVALVLCAAASAACLLGLRDMRRQRAALLRSPAHGRLTVGMGGAVTIGAIGALEMGSFAALAWRSGQSGPALLLASFAALSLALVICPGRVVADGSGVAFRTPCGGRYAIAWDEVVEVHYDARMTQIVLRGEGRQLALWGLAVWSGPHRLLLAAYLGEQVARRGIPTSTGRRKSI